MKTKRNINQENSCENDAFTRVICKFQSDTQFLKLKTDFIFCEILLAVDSYIL